MGTEQLYDPSETALVIIDMQNDFVKDGGVLKVKMAEQTVPAIKRLLQFAREKGWMVVHVVRRHDPEGKNADTPRRRLFLPPLKGYCVEGTHGAEIISELRPLPTEMILAKTRNSAFCRTEFESELRRRGIRNLVVCGTQYPNCIRATANDAMSLDFTTVVATDCCSAQTPEIANANILDLRNMGISCIPSADIMVSE